MEWRATTHSSLRKASWVGNSIIHGLFKKSVSIIMKVVAIPRINRSIAFDAAGPAVVSPVEEVWLSSLIFNSGGVELRADLLSSSLSPLLATSPVG